MLVRTGWPKGVMIREWRCNLCKGAGTWLERRQVRHGALRLDRARIKEKVKLKKWSKCLCGDSRCLLASSRPFSSSSPWKVPQIVPSVTIPCCSYLQILGSFHRVPSCPSWNAHANSKGIGLPSLGKHWRYSLASLQCTAARRAFRHWFFWNVSKYGRRQMHQSIPCCTSCSLKSVHEFYVVYVVESRTYRPCQVCWSSDEREGNGAVTFRAAGDRKGTLQCAEADGLWTTNTSGFETLENNLFQCIWCWILDKIVLGIKID